MRHVRLIPIMTVLLAAIMFPHNSVAGQFFGIIEYKPSPYVESADEPFFYSIGKTLRYDRTISGSSPTVFKGSLLGDDLKDVYVSPDNKKAAVFYGDNLYLTKTTGPALLLLTNCKHNNIEKVGKIYYSDLQWDAESRFIYMIRDKKQVPTPQSCWRSPDAVLVRIDINSPTKVVEVIKNFNSLHYYFVGNDTICFDYAPGDGSVEWKCSHHGNVSRIKSQQNSQIVLENGTVINGKPFLSYSSNIHESEIWLSNNGFTTRRADGDITEFFSKHDSKKPLFKIQGGHNIKGHYVNGILQTGCKVLPGGRYALLNVWHDNFKGQLLVDGLTGKYRELPANTQIYLNLNSLNYAYFKFDIGPMTHPEFVPAVHLSIP
jgi:hypothetical protein